MEPRTVLNEKFFIVTRGKSRKGFCRGCIGRIESETKRGEFVGLLYGGNSNPGTPKNGGLVKIEDMYPLTRHQAQLLLFISSASRRLELLCNPQLFSAICELSQDDLVVVKHKNGHLPGLVKNLMQIGRKDNKDDLYMLAFEVEFVVSSFYNLFLHFDLMIQVVKIMECTIIQITARALKCNLNALKCTEIRMTISL